MYPLSWPCQQQAGPNVVVVAADLECTFARVFTLVTGQVLLRAFATQGMDGGRPHPHAVHGLRTEPCGVVEGGFLRSFSPGSFPHNHRPRAPVRCTARASKAVYGYAHGGKRNGVAQGGTARARREEKSVTPLSLRCGFGAVPLVVVHGACLGLGPCCFAVHDPVTRVGTRRVLLMTHMVCSCCTKRAAISLSVA